MTNPRVTDIKVGYDPDERGNVLECSYDGVHKSWPVKELTQAYFEDRCVVKQAKPLWVEVPSVWLFFVTTDLDEVWMVPALRAILKVAKEEHE